MISYRSGFRPNNEISGKNFGKGRNYRNRGFPVITHFKYHFTFVIWSHFGPSALNSSITSAIWSQISQWKCKVGQNTGLEEQTRDSFRKLIELSKYWLFDSRFRIRPRFGFQDPNITFRKGQLTPLEKIGHTIEIRVFGSLISNTALDFLSDPHVGFKI